MNKIQKITIALVILTVLILCAIGKPVIFRSLFDLKSKAGTLVVTPYLDKDGSITVDLKGIKKGEVPFFSIHTSSDLYFLNKEFATSVDFGALEELADLKPVFRGQQTQIAVPGKASTENFKILTARKASSEIVALLGAEQLLVPTKKLTVKGNKQQFKYEQFAEAVSNTLILTKSKDCYSEIQKNQEFFAICSEFTNKSPFTVNYDPQKLQAKLIPTNSFAWELYKAYEVPLYVGYGRASGVNYDSAGRLPVTKKSNVRLTGSFELDASKLGSVSTRKIQTKAAKSSNFICGISNKLEGDFRTSKQTSGKCRNLGSINGLDSNNLPRLDIEKFDQKCTELVAASISEDQKNRGIPLPQVECPGKKKCDKPEACTEESCKTLGFEANLKKEGEYEHERTVDLDMHVQETYLWFDSEEEDPGIYCCYPERSQDFNVYIACDDCYDKNPISSSSSNSSPVSSAESSSQSSSSQSSSSSIQSSSSSLSSNSNSFGNSSSSSSSKKSSSSSVSSKSSSSSSSSSSARSSSNSSYLSSSLSSSSSNSSFSEASSQFSSFISSIFSSSITSLGTSSNYSSSSDSQSSESSQSSGSSESSGSSSSGRTCFLCIYDSTDPKLKKECDDMAAKARKQGMSPVNVISDEESILDQKELCKCDNIQVLRAVHGQPGDEEIPFELAEEIVDIAPQCSTLNINDMGCSRFDSANEALSEAKSLAKSLASAGYTGNVTVSGNQTITLAVLKQSELKLKIKALFSGLNPNDMVDMARRFCDNNNTPIQFQVCAEGVKLGLYPCKEPGESSVLERSSSAASTIVCEKNGKRANQSCKYSSDDPEDPDYHLCVWQEASVCNN